MSIDIIEVSSKKELQKFVKFYTTLYQSCNYSPFPLHFDEMETLLKKKNPAHKHCKVKYWMAYKNGQPAGRIAAIIKENELSNDNKPIGRYGWFDFIDDKNVSKALMDTALNWIKKHDINVVHGPFGFTDLDRQGMLIEGFDKMGTFATLYNYPYYIEHMKELKFKKSIDWVEYEINTKNLSLNRINELAHYAAKKYEFSLVELSSRKELKKYIHDVFNLLNDAYADLYGFMKLTEEQVKHYAKMFINLIKLDFVSLVVDKNKELIGFGIAMPSFTEASRKAKGRLLPFGWYHFLQAIKKNEILDLYLVAVKSDYQSKGVNALLISHTAQKAAEFGILRAETNIELENNSKVQNMWHLFERTLHKRRRCYIKEI